MSDAILLRRGTNADVPFITNSWLKSYRNAPAVAGVPDRVYYTQHHKILERILPDSEVWVACNADRHDQILGWICAVPTRETLVIHYVYVKQVVRRHGIARQLFDHVRDQFPEGIVTFTQKTKVFWQKPQRGESSFFDKVRDRGFIFHPYLLFEDL